MLWNIIIVSLTIVFIVVNDGLYLRLQILALGFLGLYRSIVEYNKGWHRGFLAFMKEFEKNADISLVRDLFRYVNKKRR